MEDAIQDGRLKDNGYQELIFKGNGRPALRYLVLVHALLVIISPLGLFVTAEVAGHVGAFNGRSKREKSLYGDCKE